MRWFAAVVAFMACTVAAVASGYDDFAQGLTANVRDDSDGAVAAFTAALKSGELVPAEVAAAYRGRAAAYLELHKCDAADADLNSYAGMHVLEREALLLRARVRMCLGDGAGARANWQLFAGVKPNAPDQFAFAQMLWSAGLYGDAYEAMLLAVDKFSKYYYEGGRMVLWYAMAAERVGKPDSAKLADLVKTLDTRDWPVPVMNFYLYKLTREQVIDHTESLFSETKDRKLCQADFYLGEWYLARNDRATAKPLLADAIARCPKEYVEYSAAQDEMKRLDQPAKDIAKGSAP